MPVNHIGGKEVFLQDSEQLAVGRLRNDRRSSGDRVLPLCLTEKRTFASRGVLHRYEHILEIVAVEGPAGPGSTREGIDVGSGRPHGHRQYKGGCPFMKGIIAAVN